MRAFLALACTAAVVGTSPAAAQSTGLSVAGECAVVPILAGAIPVVEVKIGGKGPYRFAIDTGAQGHGRISRELAEELGLPKVGEVGTPAPGGTVATRPVFAAPEISVGAVSFKNLDLVALSAVRGPEIEWDGILGNALLELLPLTLDYGNARATTVRTRLGARCREVGRRPRSRPVRVPRHHRPARRRGSLAVG